MATTKRDNSRGTHKQMIRRRIGKLLPDGASVLEGFSGEGHLYRSCWRAFSGATIDKDRRKAEAAARQRRTWAVYCGDTERALAAGWMAHRAFDVVDLDPYGEPWPFVEALFACHRQWPAEWWLVLTDGYWPQRNISAASKTLMGSGDLRVSGVSDSDYIEMARRFIERRVKDNGQRLIGWRSERVNAKAGGVGQHVYLIGRDGGAESEYQAAMKSW